MTVSDLGDNLVSEPAGSAPHVPGVVQRIEGNESLDITAPRVDGLLPDWSRRGTRDRRVGIVHAQLNGVAVLCTAPRIRPVVETSGDVASSWAPWVAWRQPPAATSAGT